MAITRLNSLAIPAGTVEPADISYPLTNFSSTGIDDNASNTQVTIDSAGNVGIGNTSPSTLHGGKVLQVQSATGAELVLMRDDGGVAIDDYVGGLLFYNGDASGSLPHYSGIISRANDIYGNSRIEIFAGRSSLEEISSNTSYGAHLAVATDNASPEVATISMNSIFTSAATPANGGAGLLALTNNDTGGDSYTNIILRSVDAGGTGRHGASIAGEKDGTWAAGGGSYPMHLTLWTRPSSGNQSVRLRLRSDGNAEFNNSHGYTYSSSMKVLQFPGGSFANWTDSSNPYTYMMNNLYYDGTNWTAQYNGSSSLMNASGVGFRFYHINSVTGGNTVTLGNHILRIDPDGIKFNNDTAAANALDDYEEGTFDITLTDSHSGSDTLKMKYVKIGRVVTIEGPFRGNEGSSVSTFFQLSSTADSNLTLSCSLPFTPKDSGCCISPIHRNLERISDGLNPNQGYALPVLAWAAGSTACYLTDTQTEKSYNGATGTGGGNTWRKADTRTNVVVQFNAVYMTD